jgi:hypothetical protein
LLSPPLSALNRITVTGSALDHTVVSLKDEIDQTIQKSCEAGVFLKEKKRKIGDRCCGARLQEV